jgi:hypothetical protein
MALNIGALFATIGIDTSEYTRSMLAAQAINAAFGQGFANFIANPIAGSIALFRGAATSIFRMTDAITAHGEAWGNLAGQTGIAVESLQAIDAAARGAGLATGTAAGAMSYFTNKLGEVRVNGAASEELFKRIGVNLNGIGDSEQALRLALDAIEALPTAQQKAAAASDLFGRAAGPAVVQAIGGGSKALDGLIGKYTDLGQVLGEKTIDNLARTGDVLDDVKLAAEGLQRTALAAFFDGLGVDDNVNNDIRTLSASLRGELVPALNDLGRFFANSKEDFGGFLSFLKDVKDGVEFIMPLLEGVVGLATFLPRQVSNGGAWVAGQAVGQWQAGDVERRAQEWRNGGPADGFLGAGERDREVRRREARRNAL